MRRWCELGVYLLMVGYCGFAYAGFPPPEAIDDVVVEVDQLLTGRARLSIQGYIGAERYTLPGPQAQFYDIKEEGADLIIDQYSYFRDVYGTKLETPPVPLSAFRRLIDPVYAQLSEAALKGDVKFKERTVFYFPLSQTGMPAHRFLKHFFRRLLTLPEMVDFPNLYEISLMSPVVKILSRYPNPQDFLTELDVRGRQNSDPMALERWLQELLIDTTLLVKDSRLIFFVKQSYESRTQLHWAAKYYGALFYDALQAARDNRPTTINHYDYPKITRDQLEGVRLRRLIRMLTRRFDPGFMSMEGQAWIRRSLLIPYLSSLAWIYGGGSADGTVEFSPLTTEQLLRVPDENRARAIKRLLDHLLMSTEPFVVGPERQAIHDEVREAISDIDHHLMRVSTETGENPGGGMADDVLERQVENMQSLIQRIARMMNVQDRRLTTPQTLFPYLLLSEDNLRSAFGAWHEFFKNAHQQTPRFAPYDEDSEVGIPLHEELRQHSLIQMWISTIKAYDLPATESFARVAIDAFARALSDIQPAEWEMYHPWVDSFFSIGLGDELISKTLSDACLGWDVRHSSVKPVLHHLLRKWLEMRSLSDLQDTTSTPYLQSLAEVHITPLIEKFANRSKKLSPDDLRFLAAFMVGSGKGGSAQELSSLIRDNLMVFLKHPKQDNFARQTLYLTYYVLKLSPALYTQEAFKSSLDAALDNFIKRSLWLEPGQQVRLVAPLTLIVNLLMREHPPSAQTLVVSLLSNRRGLEREKLSLLSDWFQRMPNTRGLEREKLSLLSDWFQRMPGLRDDVLMGLIGVPEDAREAAVSHVQELITYAAKHMQDQTLGYAYSPEVRFLEIIAKSACLEESVALSIF